KSEGEMNLQSNSNEYFQYFLDQPPTEQDRKIIPESATNVIVARVLLVMGPFSIYPRHGNWPNALSTIEDCDLGARVKVLERLLGDAEPGTEYEVCFGSPKLFLRYKSPIIPSDLTATYYIVSYSDASSFQRLLAFPLSEAD